MDTDVSRTVFVGGIKQGCDSGRDRLARRRERGAERTEVDSETECLNGSNGSCHVRTRLTFDERFDGEFNVDMSSHALMLSDDRAVTHQPRQNQRESIWKKVLRGEPLDEIIRFHPLRPLHFTVSELKGTVVNDRVAPGEQRC